MQEDEDEDLWVGSKSCSTKCAYNCFPIFPIKWHVTKPCCRLHVRHARPAAAPGTYPRRRLAPPHLPLLIDQETEANHGV